MDEPHVHPGRANLSSRSHALSLALVASPPCANGSNQRHRLGRPTRNSLEQRKKRLLDTAFQLFLAEGVAAVPLADIARYAGVALRTIYRQYGGKRGLLEAIIGEIGQEHRRKLADMALEGQSWYDQLVQLAEHVAGRLARRELMRLCDIVMESNDAGLIMAMDSAGPFQVRHVLRNALLQAVGTEPVRGLHSMHDLCNHFIDCMAGARLYISTDSSDIQGRARRGLDFFMRVLPTPSGNESTALSTLPPATAFRR